MNQETKVGIFLISAIAAMLGAIIFLGDVQVFARRPSYFVDFDDVEALPPKAAVKISGVEVGKVKKVSLNENRARVTIGVDAEIFIYKNATASVGSTGIIGTRYINLDPGTPDNARLKAGDILEGVKGGSINGAMDRIATLFDHDKKYGDAIDNLKATMFNIRRVSESLNVALGNHDRELEEIVYNVRDLTNNLKAFTGDLADISGEKKQDLKVVIDNLKNITTKLDVVMTKISKGEGTIGALVNDEETAKNVKSAVASINDTAKSAKSVFGRITSIDTYWDYRYRYSSEDDEGRSDGGIYFVPRKGKFYYLGVSNMGVVPENEKHTEFERKNRFNGLIGASLGPLTGFAGVMRARGGVGMKFRPLWKLKDWSDKFELTAEAMDFSRERTVNGQLLDRAFVAAGAQFALTRWLWVGVRGEDLLERSDLQSYVNIVLKDEDLTYLLGLAAVAR